MRSFIVVQIALLAAAIGTGYVFPNIDRWTSAGTLAGQFSLLGLWLAIGPGAIRERIDKAGSGIVILVTMVLLFSRSNAFDAILLAFLHLPSSYLLFYFLLRRPKQVALSKAVAAAPLNMLQIELKHMMLMMLLVAIFLGLLRAADDSSNPIVLFLLIVLLIAGTTAVPMLAALTALSNANLVSSFVLGTILIATIIAALACFVYSQTDSFRTMTIWSVFLGTEASVVFASCMLIRRAGYALKALDDRERTSPL